MAPPHPLRPLDCHGVPLSLGTRVVGWANSFYSAAAQAGSESWKAFFFGSSDAASSITVDKPPASLWVMGLSVRAFGLSSWSLLVPEALMGVASVGLLYACVRRSTGSAGAGLLAGAVLALSPVAALMFRYNNPDALLVLLLVAAAWATLRAVEATWRGDGTTRPLRWLAFAGVLVGFAFLTKMLQAILVLPGFVVAYGWVCGKTYSYRERLRDLAVAFAAMVISAGWWVAVVALWPAADRPYIGGSQHNSILELTLGYNGFGRLTGNETGSVTGGFGGGGGVWGNSGWLRMLGSDVGGQVGWLLPTACLLLVAGLWLSLRGRLAGASAALVVWGGWLLVTTATFSFMQGIFHAYYTVALAPAIAAVVGTGTVLLWHSHEYLASALTMAVAVVVATATAFVLLGRTPDFLPWLRWTVLGSGLVCALLLAGGRRLPVPVRSGVAGLAVTAALAGPASYSIDTAMAAHSGAIPSAGPAAAGSFGPGRGGFPGTGFPGTGFRGGAGQPGFPPGFPGGAGGPTGAPGGGGGLLDGSTPSAALTALLKAGSGDYTWVTATIGSNNAAGYQLATQLPVMPVGGFNGSDPSPTLAQFEAYVRAGDIHYLIGSGTSDGFGGISPAGNSSTSISTWVAAHFTARTVDGVTIYDLSAGPT